MSFDIPGALQWWGSRPHRANSVDALRRSDDKTAEEYKLKGGDVLHLVLALRGGRC